MPFLNGSNEWGQSPSAVLVRVASAALSLLPHPLWLGKPWQDPSSCQVRGTIWDLPFSQCGVHSSYRSAPYQPQKVPESRAASVLFPEPSAALSPGRGVGVGGGSEVSGINEVTDYSLQFSNFTLHPRGCHPKDLWIADGH